MLSNRFVTWLGITPWGHIIDTAMGAVAERQSRPDVERMDALGHWLRMLEVSGGKMAEHEVRSASFNAVAAGNETVATGLQAFVYYMIRCEGAWGRVREEVDRVLKAEGRDGQGVIGFADAQKMPFLQACIKEAMRTFPSVSMGLPRVVGKGGLDIDGYKTIPEGTTVSVNPWVMHHSKEIWGEDAREFNPDRWFREDAASLERYFIPFGTGYGSCPGQNIAKMELSKICGTLVRDYDIQQVDERKEWVWKAYFTVFPSGWPVHIKKREFNGEKV